MSIYSMEEYTRIKHVCVKLAEDALFEGRGSGRAPAHSRPQTLCG